MWEYRARVVRVHDGDTCTVLLDLGLRVTTTVSVRLAGVYAPELSQPGGPECRDLLAALLAAPGDWPLVVTTRRTKSGSGEVTTLDRYVASIRAGSVDVCASMSAHISAAGYGGGIGA